MPTPKRVAPAIVLLACSLAALPAASAAGGMPAAIGYHGEDAGAAARAKKAREEKALRAHRERVDGANRMVTSGIFVSVTGTLIGAVTSIVAGLAYVSTTTAGGLEAIAPPGFPGAVHDRGDADGLLGLSIGGGAVAGITLIVGVSLIIAGKVRRDTPLATEVNAMPQINAGVNSDGAAAALLWRF